MVLSLLLALKIKNLGHVLTDDFLAHAIRVLISCSGTTTVLKPQGVKVSQVSAAFKKLFASLKGNLRQ